MKVKQFTIILTILLSLNVCYGQQNPILLKGKESFLNIPDSVIRNEIASFSLKGKSVGKADSLLRSKMFELPITYCSDNAVSFIYPQRQTYIHFNFAKFDTTGHKLSYTTDPKPHLVLIDNNEFWGTDGEIPQKKIDSIFFVDHSHFWVRIPKTAYAGIYEPNTCTFDTQKGKKKNNGIVSLKVKLKSPYSKVFLSSNRRRFYLYMLNGSGSSKYEVIWIFNGDQYYTRTIDYGV